MTTPQPVYVAPARYVYQHAHTLQLDGRTGCGRDTTNLDELWQPVHNPKTVCTACLSTRDSDEEPTLV